MSCLIDIVTGADRGLLPPSLEPRVQIRPFCPRQVGREPEMISRKSSADVHLSGRSLRKMVRQASDGIRQSPLGERETEPTFGQSGRQERLNCWAKKRLMNVFSHLRMVASSYTPSKALRARK